MMSIHPFGISGPTCADLDKLAHHLHALVDGIDRGWYSGHVDRGTRHVHRLLTSLNRSIHQMERGVAAYSAPVYHHHDVHYYGHSVSRGHHGHY